MGDNDAQVFMLILVFLSLWTGIIGVVNMASSGQITLGTIGSMTGTIPGQVNFNVDTPTQINDIYDQDYTNSSGYDANLTFPQTGGILTDYGTWSQGPNGYELIADSGWLSGRDPRLYLDNIIPANGVYSVSYVIDNVPNTEFYLIPRASAVDPGELHFTKEVHFESDGIHIPAYVDIAPPSYDGPMEIFIPFPGVQTTIPGGSIITCDYNQNLNQITITKDGAQLFSTTLLTEVSPNSLSGKMYYGGVSSDSPGFILKGTQATRTSTVTPTGIRSFWDSLVETIAGIIPGGTAVLQFFAIIGAAIGLSANPAVPLGIWAIAGVPAIVTLIYLGLKLARGS